MVLMNHHPGAQDDKLRRGRHVWHRTYCLCDQRLFRREQTCNYIPIVLLVFPGKELLIPVYSI